MAERPQDMANRLRREALALAKTARTEALAQAKESRREALARAKAARDEGMARATDAFGEAFQPLTQERRRAITRQHLIEAAAMVFARNGFHGASLDEVAQVAGFTKGAVYSNFKSKEDLFLAVLDDRIERQFVVITEALDTDSHTREEQLPRIADAIHAQMWDDNWSMLFLEFVLYASRNAEAKSKLIAFQRKSRQLIEELIKAEYAAAGPEPKYPTQTLAIISMAIFNGLGVEHLIDPTVMGGETLETLLSFMYDAMGVDDDLAGPGPPGTPGPPAPPTPPGRR